MGMVKAECRPQHITKDSVEEIVIANNCLWMGRVDMPTISFRKKSLRWFQGQIQKK